MEDIRKQIERIRRRNVKSVTIDVTRYGSLDTIGRTNELSQNYTPV